MLTTFDADELVLRALQAGAAGFLLKDTPPAEIVRAIELVHAGDGMLSPGVTRRLIALVAGDVRTRRRGTSDARERLAALSAREHEVALAVGAGRANAEIARRAAHERRDGQGARLARCSTSSASTTACRSRCSSRTQRRGRSLRCMPSTSTLLTFAVAAFLLVALPGPNMLYLLARSVSEGRRAGVLSALGTETGTLIHVTAAAVGLSALLASSATAFAFVKYAGAAYLVYLGVRVLLGGRRPEREREAPLGGRSVFRQAVMVQVLNPKVAIFFLAFLPQFVDPASPAASQIVVLGLVLASIGLVIGIPLALAAGWLAQRYRVRRSTGGRPWSRWASGCLYLALGAYAALSPAQRTR